MKLLEASPVAIPGSVRGSGISTLTCFLALCLWLLPLGAKAEPYAAGYGAVLLGNVTSPRGIDRLGDDLLVLTIAGDLILIDESGNQTLFYDLPAGSWVGPAVNPETRSVYVSHYNGGAVYEISDGLSIPIATDILGPGGLEVSPDGTALYVSAYNGNKVHRIDTETYDRSDCADGNLPDGLELWRGDLYIANRGNHTISRVEDGCGAATLFAQGGLSGPIDIESDDLGLLVANFNGRSVTRVAADGQVSAFAAGFNGPVGLTHAVNGDLVVAEFYGHSVWALVEANVSGTVSGLTMPVTVCCINATTGQEVKIPLDGQDRSYDCTISGLVVSVGELVVIEIEASPAEQESAPTPLEFTKVPAYDTDENLEGRAFVDDPTAFAVATYIKVGGGWWTKPRWDSPTVPVRSDGTFIVDITTGGWDHRATEIVSYLVDYGFSPDLRSGQPDLPDWQRKDLDDPDSVGEFYDDAYAAR